MEALSWMLPPPVDTEPLAEKDGRYVGEVRESLLFEAFSFLARGKAVSAGAGPSLQRRIGLAQRVVLAL